MANFLIVDDSATTRRIISQMVGRLNHTVVAEAKTGIESFEMFEKYKPDLVTMDMEMPDGDGVSALKNIIGKYPKAVIIMVTTVSSREKVLECIQLGAKNYIIKPLDEPKFISVINDAIAKFVKPDNNSMSGKANETKNNINSSDPSDTSDYHLSGTFILDLYKKTDNSTVSKIINSIQGILTIQPVKFIFQIHVKKNEFNSGDLDNITKIILDAGGMVEIQWN